MKDFFETFSKDLRRIQEQLDILEKWHEANGHEGALEISERLNKAIVATSIDFYKLSDAYKEREAEHEAFFKANVDNLLGALQHYDDESKEYWLEHGENPTWLLFDYLEKEIRAFEPNSPIDPTATIWLYLRNLVVKDMEERGIL